MKIGIVMSYVAKNPAGLERFSLDLLKALNVSTDIKYTVYIKKGTDFAKILLDNGIANVDLVEVGFGKFWKDLGLFFAPRADVYVFNGPIVPFFFAPENFFVILHDFAYRHIKPGSRKEWLKSWLIDVLTRKAINRAKKVITVSNATKKDLMELYGVDSSRIVTIYPGFRSICSHGGESVPLINLPYFLYVGTLKERKNVVSVIKAFSLYKQQRKDNFTLVIVGKVNMENPYVRELYHYIEENNLTDSVIFTGHITDAQMSFVYQHASILVFPSLLEGFGFPVLEAMSCGLPVVTSNNGSLAELSGEAAILVDPLDIEEIAKAMKKIVDDHGFRMKLVASGLERVKIFNWTKTASELERLVVNNSVIV